MIYLYGAGHYDNVVGRNLIWKANVGFKKHRIQEFIEKDNTRAAFENMLDIVKKGDMVVITSVAAFDDGSDFSIMRKIRRLEGIGVKLVVETEKNFSYAAYETWYRQKKEIEESRVLLKLLVYNIVDGCVGGIMSLSGRRKPEWVEEKI